MSRAHENAIERRHGRAELERSLLPKADCFIDVFEAVPTLEAFVTQRGGTVLDNAHDIAGMKAARGAVKEGKVAVRKLAAIAHVLQYVVGNGTEPPSAAGRGLKASRHYPPALATSRRPKKEPRKRSRAFQERQNTAMNVDGAATATAPLLIWLDVDVQANAFQRRNEEDRDGQDGVLPAAVMQWFRQRDISYVAKSVCWEHAADARAKLASPWDLPDVKRGCSDDFRIDGLPPPSLFTKQKLNL
mmetsp:Transcript_35949/g.112864  ORF Transcript_35949/g.112864 Transcript_35949/m.112864 type:complete len:245 (-) Transcript_35949:854-1588(-)